MMHKLEGAAVVITGASSGVGRVPAKAWRGEAPVWRLRAAAKTCPMMSCGNANKLPRLEERRRVVETNLIG